MNRLILLGAACALAGCGLTVDYDPGDGGDAALPDASLGDGSMPIDAGDIDGGSDAGVDAVVCIDQDGDGVDSCSDCDDADPTVYPGAPLICGDGIVNDCPGGAGDETVCGGIGTYVSQATGSDSNPGTQAMPVQTVHAGINNALTIGMGVDVYVAEGTYRESITMQDTHSVLCGYEASAWTRDTNVYTSDITLMTNAGVLFPDTTTSDTVIEGCTLRGRSGVSASTVVSFVRGSSGVALDNIVYGGNNAGGQSAGILVYSGWQTMTGTRPNNGGTPVVEGNVVYMGNSQNGWGNNRQSLGIVSWQTLAQILDNEVFLANSNTIQRGIEVSAGLSGTTVRGNRIRGTGNTDLALTLRIIGGYADVTHNDVYPGTCSRNCIAAEVGGALETVRFANNVFIGGESSSDRSAGMWFDFERPPPSLLDVLIHSNFLAGGATGYPAVGIGWWAPMGGSPVQVGRVINNVIRAGGGSNPAAMYESFASIDPVLVENNALFSPPSSGSTLRALYYSEGATMLTSAAAINALPEAMGTNIVDDCSVVDPRPDGNHHLGAGSICIDAGSNTDVPSDDFEYEGRPQGAGPDIGPDEAG